MGLTLDGAVNFAIFYILTVDSWSRITHLKMIQEKVPTIFPAIYRSFTFPPFILRPLIFDYPSLLQAASLQFQKPHIKQIMQKIVKLIHFSVKKKQKQKNKITE